MKIPHELKVGRIIRALRIERNLTLRDLSKSSGVQIATLSRIEQESMLGTIESHAKIAKSLGIELYELYKLLSNENKKKVLSSGGGLG